MNFPLLLPKTNKTEYIAYFRLKRQIEHPIPDYKIRFVIIV